MIAPSPDGHDLYTELVIPLRHSDGLPRVLAERVDDALGPPDRLRPRLELLGERVELRGVEHARLNPRNVDRAFDLVDRSADQLEAVSSALSPALEAR